MSLCENWQGYKVVWFRTKTTHRKFFVHRLVAAAFIPNPESKDVVNHIDENKRNNQISNLEWMTGCENTQYYFSKRRIEKKIDLLEIDMDMTVALTSQILKSW